MKSKVKILRMDKNLLRVKGKDEAGLVCGKYLRVVHPKIETAKFTTSNLKFSSLLNT